MKTEVVPSSQQARIDFALERDGHRCTYRTEPHCDGIATKVLLDGGWAAFADGAPVHALRGICAACHERWAR